jgi:hypothetical protein
VGRVQSITTFGDFRGACWLHKAGVGHFRTFEADAHIVDNQCRSVRLERNCNRVLHPIICLCDSRRPKLPVEYLLSRSAPVQFDLSMKTGAFTSRAVNLLFYVLPSSAASGGLPTMFSYTTRESRFLNSIGIPAP